MKKEPHGISAENAKIFEQRFEGIERLDLGDTIFDPNLFRRAISGTYKNSSPASDNTILELRVDVDGRRPQDRLSGDVIKRGRYRLIDFIDEAILTPARQFGNIGDLSIFEPIYYTTYQYSFVVEDVSRSSEGGVTRLTGPIIYYQDPARDDETIEVRIRRVSLFSKAADAHATIFKSGKAIRSYCLPKISDYFRIVNLEIDRFQGTSFPPGVDSDLDPSPADLPEQTVTTISVFRNAGIDLRVTEDDVLNDSDSGDVGNNWSEAELHDLMEDRFDLFSNSLQWNAYGVVVPRFGDPNYSNTYYGTMFDWGGWQAGDTYFRQGCAIAEDAIQSRSSGTLYNTAAKQDRLTLQTFCHEVGHSFNLPHSWSRSSSADSASQSFMNYPWGYTGGGGESGFWSDFRWEFDDVELIWMRHRDRNDVIFGGNDWIGNNLSVFLEPQAEIENAPLELTIDSPAVLDFAEPVRVKLTLTNVSDHPQLVADRLDPEDHLVTLYIQRPDGTFVRYVPPVRRLKAPGSFARLDPGQSVTTSALVSFGARGYQFQEPGEYRLRASYGWADGVAAVSRLSRLRVAAPQSRQDEQLAYLLFDPRAAKFLYFSGSERYPEITSQLEESVKRYGKSNPRVVRQVQAALGVHESRAFKRLQEKKGERVVVVRKSRLREAITMLQDSLGALPDTKELSVDDARYTQITLRLADCQAADHQPEEANKTLASGARYLKSRKADKQLIEGLQERSKGLAKKSKSK